MISVDLIHMRTSTTAGFRGICFIALHSALVATPIPVLGADEDAGLMRFAAEACQANRESITHLRCVYRVRWGEVRDREAALKGNLAPPEGKEPIAPMHGLWIISHPHSRVVEGFDVPPKMGAVDKKSGLASLQYASDEFLSDGQFLLMLFPPGSGSVFGPEEPAIQGMGSNWTPFAAGVDAEPERPPYKLVTQALEAGRAKLLPPGEWNGLVTTAVYVTIEDQSYELHFAPDRGHLCVRRIWFDRASHAAVESLVTDASDCGGGRWFPKRVVRIDEPGMATGKPRRASIIEVEELDADYSAKPEDLQLTARAGMRIRSNKADYAVINYTTDTPISSEELPKLREELLARARRMQQQIMLNPGSPNNNPEGHAARGNLVRNGAVVIAVAITAWAAFGIVRKRRRRA
jgi:hypothetical protein